MGSCTSHRPASIESHSTLDMADPHSTKRGQHKPAFGFKKPTIVKRTSSTICTKSADSPDCKNPEERKPLTSVSDNAGRATTGPPKTKKPGRFGFRLDNRTRSQGDSNSNLMAGSSDSVKTEASGSSVASRSSFDPQKKNGKEWRLIDDDSKTKRKSLSHQGLDNTRDNNGNAKSRPSSASQSTLNKGTNTKRPSSASSSREKLTSKPSASGSSSSLSKLGKVFSRPVVKSKSGGFLPKFTPLKDKWTKADSVDPEQGDTTKQKLLCVPKKEKSSQRKPLLKSKTFDHGDVAPPGAEDPKRCSLYSEFSSKFGSEFSGEDKDNVTVISIRDDQSVSCKKSSTKKPKQVVPPVYPEGKAPLASVDSLDINGSTESLHSDDLMLETEVGLEEEESVRPRLDSMSSCRTRVSEDSVSRRQRTNSFRKNRRSLEREHPLHELTSLMTESGSLPRRHPKISKASRPNSFPGPAMLNESLEDPEDRPTSMAPIRLRRQAPTVADDEQVLMDGFTHRHLMQDITLLKTMLLKLKRNIQEEDIGSPFGKNGYHFGGGSQPSSPAIKEDAFQFVNEKELSKEEILQENFELKHQMSQLQKQLEERDRTIKLLQQQMTKYECGNLDSQDGRAYTDNATQTDKPKMAVPKLRTPTEPKSPPGESVISNFSQGRQERPQPHLVPGQAGKQTEVKGSSPNSQQNNTPRPAGGRQHNKKNSYQSRLPSLGAKKNNKPQHHKISNGVA